MIDIKQHNLDFMHLHEYIYNVKTLFNVLKRIPVYFDKSAPLDKEFKQYFNNVKNKAVQFSAHKNWIENFEEFIENELKFYNQKQDLNQEDGVSANYLNEEEQKLVEFTKIKLHFLNNLWIYIQDLETDVKENRSNKLDLALLMNENQKDNHIFNDEFYNEIVSEVAKSDDLIVESVVKTILSLKNEYGIKEVFYSNEIAPKNLLKQLMYVKNSLDEIVLNLELEYPEFSGLKDKYLCIDLGAKGYKDDFIYIQTNLNDTFPNTYFKVVFEKLVSDKKDIETKQGNVNLSGDEFIEMFWSSFCTPSKMEEKDKFLYIQLFSEYLYECKNLVNDNKNLKANLTKEMEFIDGLLNQLNGFLDMKEAFELNKDKNVFFYNKWREDFVKDIEEFNTKRMLNRNFTFKKEIFKLAFLFKHIVLNQYRLCFWKDMLIISKLTDLSFKYFENDDLDFNQVETFIFNIIKDNKLLQMYLMESKEFIIEDLMEKSFIGFINYYRENKEFFDKTTVPYIENEAVEAKDFWEDNLSDLVIILNKS